MCRINNKILYTQRMSKQDRKCPIFPKTYVNRALLPLCFCLYSFRIFDRLDIKKRKLYEEGKRGNKSLSIRIARGYSCLPEAVVARNCLDA